MSRTDMAFLFLKQINPFSI